MNEEKIAASRPPQVAEQLSRYGSLVSELMDVANQLEDRLIPVTLPKRDEPKSQLNKAPENPEWCPVAGDLRLQNSALMQVLVSLRDLQERLEV